MTKLFLILLFLTTSLLGDMYWADDYKSGVKEAAKNNKNIIVYFSKEDSVKCDEMTWTMSFDKNVSNYISEHFVAIEIDVEYDKRQGFKVYKTPTTYFLKPNKKQIGKPFVGSEGPKDFLKRLKTIVAGGK